MVNMASCPSCGYPVEAKYPGQKVSCVYCSEHLQAVSRGISSVTIPTSLVVALVSFTIGVIFGPTVIASTSEGRKWLEEKARSAIRR